MPKQRQKVVINYPPVPTKKWIPPDKRPKKKPEPVYVKPKGITQKLKISSLKKIWHQYAIVGKTAILLGHYCQTHKKFHAKNLGHQGACNCAMACTFAYLHKMADWTRSYIDEILDRGDELYEKSLQQPAGLCRVHIPPELVCNNFYFNRSKITLSIDEKPGVGETLGAVSEQKAKEIFTNAVESFFKLYPSGIFCMECKCIAVWIQDSAFYLFDPTQHDEEGRLVESGHWMSGPCSCGQVDGGFALVCRCRVVKDLIDKIFDNVTVKPNTSFKIVQCVVQRIVNINIEPPETFEEVIQGEAPVVLPQKKR
ncbi:hypothetical protein NQ318_005739 [Aromia moschata]|uniref:Uncharacterized protein n=1 Tax=Aromia moschata TaxID=1265417 RepID=A0AAV8YTX5_9CUCU|nr:hypothetical protein NQ318_005739 [Aromia moschata]